MVPWNEPELAMYEAKLLNEQYAIQNHCIMSQDQYEILEEVEDNLFISITLLAVSLLTI